MYNVYVHAFSLFTINGLIGTINDYYKPNNESSIKIACSSCHLTSFWQSGILELSLPSLLPLLSINIICIIAVIRPTKSIIVNHPPVTNPISQDL